MNYVAWNGYPKHIVNSINKRQKSKVDKSPNNIWEEDTTDTGKIYLNLKLLVNTTDRIMKKCMTFS